MRPERVLLTIEVEAWDYPSLHSDERHDIDWWQEALVDWIDNQDGVAACTSDDDCSQNVAHMEAGEWRISEVGVFRMKTVQDTRTILRPKELRYEI